MKKVCTKLWTFTKIFYDKITRRILANSCSIARLWKTNKRKVWLKLFEFTVPCTAAVLTQRTDAKSRKSCPHVILFEARVLKTSLFLPLQGVAGLFLFTDQSLRFTKLLKPPKIWTRNGTAAQQIHWVTQLWLTHHNS